jgi:hypothetical protein
MGSGKSQRTKTAFEERAPPLTRRVREKEATECLDEVAVVEQCSKLRGNIVADVRRRRGDLAHDLRTPIDHGDDVLEIAARDDVPRRRVRGTPPASSR